MKSLGKRATGLRLERMRASPQYRVTDSGEGFHNVHPIQPGLRDRTERPSLSDFLCAEGRRTPAGPLPSVTTGTKSFQLGPSRQVRTSVSWRGLRQLITTSLQAASRKRRSIGARAPPTAPIWLPVKLWIAWSIEA